MAITVPFPGLVDIRQPILGDSFGWDGLEPTAAKKSLVFHHSAAENAPGEDGFVVADYHVNHNRWGGIGYHFFITRSDYPGRAGFTPPGAQVQYVGDLGTWRAHVANQNPGRVGICFAGVTPDAEQLRLGRELVDFLKAPNNILPSINFYNQVTVHRLVPEQSTACPGDDFGNWLPYLQGGDFPAYLTPPAPVAPPAPETPIDLNPGKGGGTEVPVTVTPKYDYTPQQEVKTVLRQGAVAVNVDTGEVIENSRANLVVGGTLNSAGFFTANGVKYYRSQYASDHGLWNGVDSTYFEPPTGNTDGVVPITVTDTPHPAPDPIIIPDPTQVASNVTDTQLQEATVPVKERLSIFGLLKELIAQFTAFAIKKRTK